MNRFTHVLVVFVCALTLAACGGGNSNETESEKSAEETSPFVLAYNACKELKVGNPYAEDDEQVRAGSVMQVEKDALIVDGAGDQYVSGPTADCVLDELEAPTSVRSQIESTTAMMGRQSDTWGDFEATWSFHPDNGLDLVVSALSQ